MLERSRLSILLLIVELFFFGKGSYEYISMLKSII
jgi:hypothetical protein